VASWKIADRYAFVFFVDVFRSRECVDDWGVKIACLAVTGRAPDSEERAMPAKDARLVSVISEREAEGVASHFQRPLWLKMGYRIV
jgi:hypothetical protein